MLRKAHTPPFVIPSEAKRRREPALSVAEGDLRFSFPATNAEVLLTPCRDRASYTSAVMAKRDHHYFVYIMASRTHVLYCGLTNHLTRRVEEHRHSTPPAFTALYRCDRLVWFEKYQYVRNAINREKEIKRWRRSKKIQLIEEQNPTWADLSEQWRETADPSPPLRSARDDKGKA